jgi:hypothetical protein
MYRKLSTEFLTDAQASKSHDRDWIVETTKRTQKILHHMIQQIGMDYIYWRWKHGFIQTKVHKDQQTENFIW